MEKKLILSDDQMSQLAYDMASDFEAIKDLAAKIDSWGIKEQELEHSLEMAKINKDWCQQKFDLKHHLFFKVLDEFPSMVKRINDEFNVRLEIPAPKTKEDCNCK